MINKEDRNQARKRRHLRVRKKCNGTPSHPRLNVFRSNNQIYAQVIDDINGCTLVSASTLDPGLKSEGSSGGNAEAARRVGKLVAQRALDKGIEKVVFDRGGYLYHGRVKELADGAREGGLQF